MSMLAGLVEVVIGGDTHKDTHTAAVLDARIGGALARSAVPAIPTATPPFWSLLSNTRGLWA